MNTVFSGLIRLFSSDKDVKNQGLGTFLGVYLPTILMLFGVIIFLRLGWIVGQAGLPTTLSVVSFAALIVLLTALSMAAISTNTEIGKGGVYYILSRSLGLEAGSAVGLPLYIKQTLSISFSIVGFAESLHDLIPSLSITTIGIWTLVVLSIFAVASLKGALKLQVIIFVSLIASLISFFAGGTVSELHPDAYIPKAPGHLSTWAIFALFFPAMTGIESSVSLSGDLKNPSKSLPIGTITAIITAYAVYMAMPIFLTSHVSLERLATDPLIMQDIAKIPSLIILGIWAATLSSALGGLLAAPRTLVAISEDGVVSRYFAKTYGKSSEPRIATLTTFVLAFLGIYFGSINIIAPLLTMICLICYSVLNFCCAFETYMQNPSWRPRFRVHWLIPFSGGVLSLVTMLMIDSGAAIVAFILMMGIYLVAKYRNLHGSWEDIRQGLLLFMSRFAIYRLSYQEAGVSRSWRPHFLVFTDKPEEHSRSLLNFSQAISQNKGFLTMASIVPSAPLSETERRRQEMQLGKKLEQQKIQALVQISYAEEVVSGMHQMIENYGIGPLMPNTVVFGGISHADSAIEFAKVIHSAYHKHCNIVIMNDQNVLSLRDLEGPASHTNGDIHIWWDDEGVKNSEFMVILAYMLQRNRAWKRSKICVKGFAKDEARHREKVTTLQEFAQKKRMNLDVEIYITDRCGDALIELIQSHSKDAGMVFLSMQSPEQASDLVHFANYLQDISQQAKRLGPSAFILSSEHTPLQMILR